MNILKYSNIVSSTVYYYFQRKWYHQKKKKYYYDSISNSKFEELLANIDYSNVFIHLSLSSINKFSPYNNKYEYLKKQLLTNFNGVVTNAFTPQVKVSKLFKYSKTKPLYGAFSKLIMNDISFRNNDPIYSLVGIGNINLNDSKFTFDKKGVFNQMIDNDYCCLNIGLQYVTCSIMHLIEQQNNVPYINMINSRIKMIEESKLYEYKYYNYKKRHSIKGYLRWNKRKIMNDMRSSGMLNEVEIGGVKIYHFGLKDFYHLIDSNVKSDPYYLITW